MAVDVQPQRGAHLAARRQHIVWNRLLTRALFVAVLLVLTVTFALPFYWLLSTAVKPTIELFVAPPIWIPSHLEGPNFRNAVNFFHFVHYLPNTRISRSAAPLGTLLPTSP